jgi:hypothetical protein
MHGWHRRTRWLGLLHLGKNLSALNPGVQNSRRRAKAERKDRQSGRGYGTGHDVERPVVFGKLERSCDVAGRGRIWRAPEAIFGREVVPDV